MLLKVSLREDDGEDYSLVDLSYLAIIGYIHLIKDANVSLQYLEMFLSSYAHAKGNFKKEKCSHVQTGLLSSIHVNTLATISHFFAPFLMCLGLYHHHARDFDQRTRG